MYASRSRLPNFVHTDQSLGLALTFQAVVYLNIQLTRVSRRFTAEKLTIDYLT